MLALIGAFQRLSAGEKYGYHIRISAWISFLCSLEQALGSCVRRSNGAAGILLVDIDSNLNLAFSSLLQQTSPPRMVRTYASLTCLYIPVRFLYGKQPHLFLTKSPLIQTQKTSPAVILVPRVPYPSFGSTTRTPA